MLGKSKPAVLGVSDSRTVHSELCGEYQCLFVGAEPIVRNASRTDLSADALEVYMQEHGDVHIVRVPSPSLQAFLLSSE